MLQISSIDNFRSRVLHKEEIREADLGSNCISFCYMVAAEGTFDDEWSRECRGIVFDKTTGKVVGRPLHKFFNVNERPETHVNNLDWSKVVRVMDKRDGSMIHTVKVDDGIRLKSKKAFTSEVAIAAEKWLRDGTHDNVLKFCERVAEMGKTAIFEWTAPDARIVLKYPTAELQLLHVRDNETGEYMKLPELKELAAKHDVKIVDEIDLFFDVDELSQRKSFNITRMLAAAKVFENIEGWVVQFEDGQMVKIKTDWYLKRHRAITFIRERDIAQLVLDEGLDDIKSMLVGDGVDISEILEIERKVLHDIREIAMTVDLAVAEDKNLDRKEFALKHKDTEFFGLKMAKYLGKEPSYKEYYKNNLFKLRFSLRQLALIPSVAEGD